MVMVKSTHEIKVPDMKILMTMWMKWVIMIMSMTIIWMGAIKVPGIWLQEMLVLMLMLNADTAADGDDAN